MNSYCMFSPGANNSQAFDGALKERCQDADVMVMVLDATRNLSESVSYHVTYVLCSLLTQKGDFLSINMKARWRYGAFFLTVTAVNNLLYRQSWKNCLTRPTGLMLTC